MFHVEQPGGTARNRRRPDPRRAARAHERALVDVPRGQPTLRISGPPADPWSAPRRRGTCAGMALTASKGAARHRSPDPPGIAAWCSTWNSRRFASGYGCSWPVSATGSGALRARIGPMGVPAAAAAGGGPALGIAAWCSTWNSPATRISGTAALLARCEPEVAGRVGPTVPACAARNSRCSTFVDGGPPGSGLTARHSRSWGGVPPGSGGTRWCSTWNSAQRSPWPRPPFVPRGTVLIPLIAGENRRIGRVVGLDRASVCRKHVPDDRKAARRR